jgi:hypothetical protein
MIGSELHGTLGYRNESKARTLREYIEDLTRRGVVSNDLKIGILEFWDVRNQVIHNQVFNAPLLVSAIDSGIRLLRLLKAIPRPVYVVVGAQVPLYADAACTERLQIDGVIVEATETDGSKKRMIYPAGRKFTFGEIVGWDWEMTKAYSKAFYQEVGVVKSGWDWSYAFVGKPLPRRNA